MEDINYYAKIIEDCIRDLGLDPVQLRGELEGQWNLKRGSASVYVDLWRSESSKQIYFQLLAPVVGVPPTNREQFFHELLQINHSLYGVAFSVKDNYAYIKMIREAEGLDKSEALAMIERIGYYADLYDDKLREKYFGR
ncbi:MAG: hypothetical protein KatS3mg033_0133 [Thermonema sp.]|jgi:hypothetical protein|uniref:YbjN domain-containing protein n=1 Tax=Thermonema TaxID=28194 RepID=UPI00056FC9AF|nr:MULTISPECIES: YbjN domain-containing protein [Thermonema]GIV38333.1 MAG: hypothetical protein KatS3mg033_0133 [Thermonema sp.]